MKAAELAKEAKRLRRSVENLESFLHGVVENEGEFQKSWIQFAKKQ